MRQKRAKDKRINARKKAHGRQTRQRARKPAQKRQNMKAGNKAAGRRTCGKPHAQPPGGGTSLHPGAASQTGQTAAAKAPHTQAHGGQTASRPRQRRPDQARHKSSRLPTSREQGSGALAEKCRNTGHKSRHNSGEPRKSDQPRQAARHAGRRKTPPNRQNSRSLFCLPGGAL